MPASKTTDELVAKKHAAVVVEISRPSVQDAVRFLQKCKLDTNRVRLYPYAHFLGDTSRFGVWIGCLWGTVDEATMYHWKAKNYLPVLEIQRELRFKGQSK